MENDVLVDLAAGEIVPASIRDTRLLSAADALIVRHLKRGTWTKAEKPAVWSRLAAIRLQVASIQLSEARRRRRNTLVDRVA